MSWRHRLIGCIATLIGLKVVDGRGGVPAVIRTVEEADVVHCLMAAGLRPEYITDGAVAAVIESKLLRATKK